MAKKQPLKPFVPKPAVGYRTRRGVAPVPKRAGAKKASAHESKAKVTFADVGGYRVYTTPVRPAHFTEEQIRDAIASLD